MKHRPWLVPVLALLLAFAASDARAATTSAIPLGAESSALTPDASLGADPIVPNFRLLIDPEYPTTLTPISLHLIGASPYGLQCADVVESQVIDTGHVSLSLRPSAEACSTAMWRHSFMIGRMPTGWHLVKVDIHYVAADSSGDTTQTVFTRVFRYFVAQATTPPTPGLPYVESVRFLPKNLRPSIPNPPICPGDSIGVQFNGTFPNECFALLRIELIPNPSMSPLPLPPWVRLIVDTTQCLRRVCEPNPTPWQGSVTLPPIWLPGEYPLRVEMAVGSCIGPTQVPPPEYFADYRFSVSACSTSAEGCVLGYFDHPNGRLGCDASVAPGRPDTVVFAVKSSVALSGLQGEFHFGEPPLRITRIEPIGFASGMRLAWTRTDDGAKFVMFAESGAPIPALPPSGDVLPLPILAITVEAPNGQVLPGGITILDQRELFGSDLLGRAVYPCPTIALYPPEHARICRERDCDRNADGLLDVRDLVLLVHCLTDSVRCDLRGADCNSDSTFNLDDVLCCARRLLGVPLCRECDTTLARREPIELSLGTVFETGGEVIVPVVLTNAERFSAARLAIDYPADRYDVAGVGLQQLDPRVVPPEASRWLDLHEVRDGQVIIGLISLGTMTLEVGQQVVVHVRLRLKPGRVPGGSVVASESDFSGGDGVKLIIGEGRTRIDLAGRASVQLSDAVPNPFASETRFTLTLDRTANVDLAIYDVTGRVVSILHRGQLPAGTREFFWNGTIADGSRAATGVYFYRASVPGGAVSRKLVLLRVH